MFSDAAFARRAFPASAFRLVIFFSDIAAADRALRSVRDSLRRSDDPRPLEPMLWNVALLAEPQWLRLAAADVAQADLCVLSLDGGDLRTNDAAVWLRELAPRLARHWITLAPFEDPGAARLPLQQAV